MLFSVFYKEYIKIRLVWFFIFLCNALMMIFISLKTRQLFELDHAEIVWYRLIQLGQIHYEALQYAPLLSGILIACIQFLPEMTGERLRLSLHLPLPPALMILAHLLVGTGAVTILCGFDLLALAYLTSAYFPGQVVTNTLMTALPWALAGLAAYIGTTLTLLEPRPQVKFFNLLLSAGMIKLFFETAYPGTYAYALAPLLILLALMIPAALLPAYRFRFRRVN